MLACLQKSKAAEKGPPRAGAGRRREEAAGRVLATAEPAEAATSDLLRSLQDTVLAARRVVVEVEAARRLARHVLQSAGQNWSLRADALAVLGQHDPVETPEGLADNDVGGLERAMRLAKAASEALDQHLEALNLQSEPLVMDSYAGSPSHDRSARSSHATDVTEHAPRPSAAPAAGSPPNQTPPAAVRGAECEGGVGFWGAAGGRPRSPGGARRSQPGADNLCPTVPGSVDYSPAAHRPQEAGGRPAWRRPFAAVGGWLKGLGPIFGRAGRGVARSASNAGREVAQGVGNAGRGVARSASMARSGAAKGASLARSGTMRGVAAAKQQLANVPPEAAIGGAATVLVTALTRAASRRRGARDRKSVV